MKCPCGGETKVVDTRPTKVGITRRRVCLECHKRFSTCEIRADDLQAVWKQLNVAKVAFVQMGKLIKGFEIEKTDRLGTEHKK